MLKEDAIYKMTMIVVLYDHSDHETITATTITTLSTS